MEQIEVVFLYIKQNCNYKFMKKKPSPLDGTHPNLSPNIERSLYFAKRPFLSVSSKVKGSMTVEAVIVVPLFIFFFLNLISYIEIYRLHSNFTMALYETGSEMAIYGHIYEKMKEEEDGFVKQQIKNVGFSYLYVKKDVVSQLGKHYLETSPLTYGEKGMNFLHSSIMNDENIIDLVLTYEVSPLISEAGFPSFYMVNRFYAKAYTGYDLKEKENRTEKKEYVYLAENGKVYHTCLNCSHLKLSIKKINNTQISTVRNKDGEKYKPCEYCAKGNKSKEVYITEQGNCYHNNIQCSKIKRTVIAIPISEATKYPMCSRCKKREK